MSMKQLFFSSFIQGLGRASGSITVIGLLGYTWYLQKYFTKMMTTTLENKEMQTNSNNNDNDDNHDNCCNNKSGNSEGDFNEDHVSEDFNGDQCNYKKIFENL